MITYIISAVIIVLALITIIGVLTRYKKCPSDKILIVFGKAGKTADGKTTPSKIIHGGGTFVWPIIQDYAFMSTTPTQISLETDWIRSGSLINVKMPVSLTVAIGAGDPALMQAAATHLLSVEEKIKNQMITNYLLGGIRSIVANLEIEEINKDRDKFLNEAKKKIEPDLAKLGLKILALTCSDLIDQDGYLDNLSKRAATKAKATSDADIAEQTKIGTVSVANTKKEQAIAVAEAEKERETTVNATLQEKEIKLAEIERTKVERTAEIAKDQATNVANFGAEQKANEAKALAAAQKAEVEAQQDANAKTAEMKAAATAKIAKANAEAEAEKAEAEALKQTRMAEAIAKQQSATEKANQEKEAQIAQYTADKEKKQAEALKQAGVANANAKAEVFKAEGDALKVKAEADQIAKTSQVKAELAVEQERQLRQQEVNEAEAKAQEAKLKADKIVPAEALKKEAEIKASQNKAVKVIEAEAIAESKKTQAKGEADAILEVAAAEAQAVEMKGEAEAKAIKAKLAAQYETEVSKAEGLSKAEVAGILQLSEKLGDPQAAVQFFMKDVTRDTQIAQAYAGSLREIMGNVTVYGDSATAGTFASNILNILPQIRKVGQALGETITVAKDAWNTKTPTPTEVNDLGEKEFDDVH